MQGNQFLKRTIVSKLSQMRTKQLLIYRSSMNADLEKTVLVFMTTALARSFRAKITVEVGF